MLDIYCIFCSSKQGLDIDGELKDHDGCTLDCVYCSKTMIVEDGKLKDLNEILKIRYKEMGVEIDENKDYTKSFVEF